MDSQRLASTRPGSHAKRFSPQFHHGQSTRADLFDIVDEVATYKVGESIYRQGDACDRIFYIRAGEVRLSVISTIGRQAVVAMLTRGDFFGEGCLAGQPLRTGTATAVTESAVTSLNTAQMLDRLRQKRTFSDRFITHMLARNIRIERDLLNQFFDSSEKRLARTLLRLARAQPGRPMVRISQETLSNMVGTTRSRINLFMKKFQRLGFIDYKSGLKVNAALLAQHLQGSDA